MDRIVTVYFPPRKKDDYLPYAFMIAIQNEGKDITIYECIERLSQVYDNEKKKCHYSIVNNVSLSEIINLHNSNGIQDLSRIHSMFSDLNNGKELLMENELPNIKLVVTRVGKLVLFDGHHTLISYMIAGRKLLSDVPHIIVINKNFGFVTDKEIHIFFGEHASKLENKDWRDYVINCQATEEKQLCNRIQRNMGELVDLILKQMSSAKLKYY